MTTMIKRFSVCLTKENKRQLEELCEKLGENRNQIIVRALQALHRKYEKLDNEE